MKERSPAGSGASATCESQFTPIRSALDVLVEPGSVVELRLPDTGRKGRVISGYYQDLDALAAVAEKLTAKHPAVYLTLNPVTPALLARRANRVVEYPEKSTSDRDIERRRWLFIDLDPERPAGIATTDEEHEAAIEQARRLWTAMQKRQWPQPVVLDSGNGAYLLWRIDLPNDDESAALVEGCLEALGRMTDLAVKVDQTAYNASRIARLPGTWNRKGDEVHERHHRLCRVLHTPERLDVVSVEQLRELAAVEASSPPDEKAAADFFSASRITPPTTFDPAAFVAQHLDVRDEGPYEGGYRWVLRRCPLHDEDTSGTSCSVIQWSSGTLIFKCQHDRCTGRKWADLRERFEPGYRDRRDDEDPLRERAGSGRKDAPEQRKQPKPPPLIVSAEALADMDLRGPRWAVPGVLIEGLVMLAAKAKLGKSWLALDLAIAVASGGRALGQLEVEAGDVLYLALEDTQRRIRDRLNTLAVRPFPARLHIATSWPKIDEGGLDHIETWLSDHRDARLVVVDVWKRIRQTRRRGAQLYDEDYEHLAELKTLADRFGVTVLVIHHTRKAGAEDVFDEISGSGGVAAALDACLILHRSRSEADAELWITGRDVEEGHKALRFDACHWSLLGEAADVARSKARRRVIEELQKGNAPMSIVSLSVALGQPRERVKALVYKMVADGELNQLPNSKYTLRFPVSSVTSVSPFPSGDELEAVSEGQKGNAGNGKRIVEVKGCPHCGTRSYQELPDGRRHCHGGANACGAVYEVAS